MRHWRRRLRHSVAPWRRRLRRSLGLRLIGLFLALALALAAVFVFGMQRALSGGYSGVVEPLVVDYVDRLAAEVGTPPDAERARALAARLPISVQIEGPLVEFETHPGRDRRHHDGEWWLSRRTADGHRITFGLGSVAWQRQPHAIGWLTLAALLLLTGAAYRVVRRLFRPLDDIRIGAERYGRGDFSRPIPLRRHDELGDLARQVNTMAAGLQRRLDAKRALLLAISHELRSPLTRARLNAELVAPGGERDALLRDLAEMRDLIADLLESERLAGGHAALQREPVDLNALVTDAAGADAELRLDPALPPLQADPARLRLVLRNLLDNARRHGGGAPLVGTVHDRAAAVLTVRDRGPGVAAELLPLLAEAFYRPDAARSRDAGGVGLGLYLCRLVVQAHGGTMTLRDAAPGLEVEVRLPL